MIEAHATQLEALADEFYKTVKEKEGFFEQVRNHRLGTRMICHQK